MIQTTKKKVYKWFVIHCSIWLLMWMCHFSKYNVHIMIVQRSSKHSVRIFPQDYFNNDHFNACLCVYPYFEENLCGAVNRVQCLPCVYAKIYVTFCCSSQVNVERFCLSSAHILHSSSLGFNLQHPKDHQINCTILKVHSQNIISNI